MQKSVFYGFFILAIFFIYGLFSFPFPRYVGLYEVVIGLLIVFLIFISGGYSDVFKFNDGSAGARVGVVNRFIFLYLLIVPTLVFVFYQWELSDFFRDVVPLFYIFMPIFFRKIDEGIVRFFIIGMLVAGTFFSLRYIYESGFDFRSTVGYVFYDEKSYYSYDPSVLFSLIYSFQRLLFAKDKIFLKFVFFAISVVTLVSLLGVTQRAPVGLFIFFTICAFFVSSKKFTGILVSVFLFILFYDVASDFLSSTIDALFDKQASHGDNNKIAEIYDALNSLNDIHSFLFGLGWGSLFYSSAYNSYFSNAHVVFSYFLIKSGFLGFLLFGIYSFYISDMLRKIFHKDFIIFFSVLAPLLVGVFFQPTYKTMTYGFMLVIVFLLAKDSKSSD